MSQYEEKGFLDRDHYLVAVSDTFLVDLAEVKRIAGLFGSTEDFSGLVETVRHISKLPDARKRTVTA